MFLGAKNMERGDNIFLDKLHISLPIRTAWTLAVDIAILAVETAWSPPMYDALEKVFGNKTSEDSHESWTGACRNILFMGGSKCQHFLPRDRTERFDLNALASLLARLQSCSQSEAGNKNRLALCGQTDTSRSSCQIPRICQVRSAQGEMCSIDAEDSSRWTQYLANLVYAFRQRWVHDFVSVSLPDSLDALLAMQELWSAFYPIPPSSSNMVVELKVQLGNSIRLVQELCRMSGSTGPELGRLTEYSAASLHCTGEWVLKLVASHVLHLVVPHLTDVLKSLTPNTETLHGGDWKDLIRLADVACGLGGQASTFEKTISHRLVGVLARCSTAAMTTQKQAATGQHLRAFSSSLKCIQHLAKFAFHYGEISPQGVGRGIKAGRQLLVELGSNERMLAEFESLHVLFGAVPGIGKLMASEIRSLYNYIMTIDLHSAVNEEFNGMLLPKNSLYIQQPRAKPKFIGRSDELLHASGDIRRGLNIVVAGSIGSGKTAFAIELAYRLRSSHTFQIWIPASSCAIIQLALRRVNYMLALCRDSSKYTPCPDSGICGALLLADDLNSPDDLVTAVSPCVLKDNIFVCTSIQTAAKPWLSCWSNITIHSLQPLDLVTSTQMLQSRTGKFNSTLLAHVATTDSAIHFFEQHITNPLAVQSFAHRLRRESFTAALETICNYTPHSSYAIGGVESSSGYAANLHSEGPEVYLRRVLPRLDPEPQLLLVTLGLLGRVSASIPWRLFNGVPYNPLVHSRNWQHFLLDQSPAWCQRREVARDALENIGIVQWCSGSQHITVNILLQRSIPIFLHEVRPFDSETAVAVADITELLCYVMFSHLHSVLISCKYPVEDEDAMCAVFMMNITESLLINGDKIPPWYSISLRVWLARACVTLFYDLPSALKHYEHATEVSRCVIHKSPLLDLVAPVLVLEYAMTLRRSNCNQKALECIADAFVKLNGSSWATFLDPCWECFHSRIWLTLKLHGEYLTTKMSSPDWQLVLEEYIQFRLSSGIDCRPSLVSIGPLSDNAGNSSIAYRPRSEYLTIIAACPCRRDPRDVIDELLGLAVSAAEYGTISKVIECITALASMATFALSSGIETLEFYHDVSRQLAAEGAAMMIRSNRQLCCLPKVNIKLHVLNCKHMIALPQCVFNLISSSNDSGWPKAG